LQLKNGKAEEERASAAPGASRLKPTLGTNAKAKPKERMEMRFAHLIAYIFVTLFVGCSTIPKYPYVYEPTKGAEVFSYYVLGTPYAAIETDCADIRMSIGPTMLNQKYYMRVFISYNNLSDQPFLFYPLDSLSLCIEDNDKSNIISATSPNEIVRSIDITKNTALFFQALSGGIEAAAVRPTTINGPGGTYKIDDVARKQQLAIDRAAGNMAVTDVLGEGLKTSFSSTVLRRHTIFPGGSLAGFAYFQAPGHTAPKGISERALAAYIASHRFNITIRTACGVQTVQFVPAPGE
jgi:hypothetical protein